jgi:organic hydroperoxide reductase OsmC/OhrA
MDKELYKVCISNKIGDFGIVTSTSGRNLGVAPTLGHEEGYNPGELIAFSWATCLEATLRYVLSLRAIVTTSYTDVYFTMTYDLKHPKGYQFLYEAKIFLDVDNQSLIDSLVEETHLRCPVSKLLSKENIIIKGYPLKK